LTILESSDSSHLGGRLFFRRGPGPCRWREIFDLGDVTSRPAGEQIFWIIKRVADAPERGSVTRSNLASQYAHK